MQNVKKTLLKVNEIAIVPYHGNFVVFVFVQQVIVVEVLLWLCISLFS